MTTLRRRTTRVSLRTPEQTRNEIGQFVTTFPVGNQYAQPWAEKRRLSALTTDTGLVVRDQTLTYRMSRVDGVAVGHGLVDGADTWTVTGVSDVDTSPLHPEIEVTVA